MRQMQLKDDATLKSSPECGKFPYSGDIFIKYCTFFVFYDKIYKSCSLAGKNGVYKGERPFKIKRKERSEWMTGIS